MNKLFSQLNVVGKCLGSGLALLRTAFVVMAIVGVLTLSANDSYVEANRGRAFQVDSIQNIVLVHGSWVDGSSWSSVIERLQEEGYNVTAVQLPLTSLADDVARTRQVLAMQDGPTILVGHSYGGAVIGELGSDAPNVVGLVYVAAFAPDEGETALEIFEQGPPSPGLAHIYPDEQGFLWMEVEGFVEFFASGLDEVQARVMAAVQKPIAASIFEETFGPPAWQSLPSWYMITENDQIIPPETQSFMAERTGAMISSIEAGHAVMVSQPDRVADLIITAAQAVQTGP